MMTIFNDDRQANLDRNQNKSFLFFYPLTII